ncbi:carbonic anhydrase 1-like [Planococcus citri]|uniref:carbonic anhydrase 1-like n=1 Tax=Planococcus citri TaxID=170843 RepID=UPI0031F80980
MNSIYKFYVLFAFLISITIQHSSQDRNRDWPEDSATLFPYPTPVPIVIDSSKVRLLKTPTPLQFNINPLQFSFTTNFGNTLVSQTAEPVIGDLTGGILYKDIYKYFQCEFYWDNDLKPDAGDLIDGRGTSFQAVASFWNTKYHSKEEAIKKRDGVASIVVPINVLPFCPNFLFIPFKFNLQFVKKAGSVTLVEEFLEYIWYFTPSLTNSYYAYPGAYPDPDTGKVYYSATVLIFNRTPRPCISYRQFKSTYGSLLNKQGKPYSHTQNITKTHSRPIVLANGIVIRLI